MPHERIRDQQIFVPIGQIVFFIRPPEKRGGLGDRGNQETGGSGLVRRDPKEYLEGNPVSRLGTALCPAGKTARAGPGRAAASGLRQYKDPGSSSSHPVLAGF